MMSVLKAAHFRRVQTGKQVSDNRLYRHYQSIDVYHLYSIERQIKVTIDRICHTHLGLIKSKPISMCSTILFIGQSCTLIDKTFFFFPLSFSLIVSQNV